MRRCGRGVEWEDAWMRGCVDAVVLLRWGVGEEKVVARRRWGAGVGRR